MTNRHSLVRRCFVLVLAPTLLSMPAHATPQGGAKDPAKSPPASKVKDLSDPATNARLQLKLAPEDRAAIERGVKYALPAPPTTGLAWIGSEPLSIEALRGRVVVVQSLSVKNNWRSVVDPLRRQLKDASEAPVVLLLQTPDGADSARKILEPALEGWIALVDSDGAWSDELGVWKKPVNLVVDRNGTVRYAGLTAEGVRAAVELLLAERIDAETPPPLARPVSESQTVSFPVFREPVGSAADQRGNPMPEFVVDSWLNGQPTPGDRLIVIDFWATWCPPCRAAIPHMNALADRFGTDACFVGLSDETKSNFEEGSMKHKLKERDFKYALALDPQARLKNFFAVKGIPHCAIVSKDGIVRWQGRPGQLTEDVMRSLIKANQALGGKAGSNTGGGRWKGAEDGSKAGGAGGRGAPSKRRNY